MSDNRRQVEQWERDALVDLRGGATDTAIDAYIDHGRLTLVADHDDACRRVVADWASHRDGQTSVMLASRHVDVERLNVLARRTLRDDGVLAGDGAGLGGKGYAVGDVVLALRNDRNLGVLNGTRAVIEQIDTDHRTIRCRTDRHEPLDLPFDYAAAHLTHGYAMTIHKAQGGTYDRCFVLAADQLTRETAYTALSRARYSTDIYVVSDDPRAEEAHVPEHQRETIDTFRDSVHRSDAQEMAIEAEPRMATAEPEPDLGIDDGIDIGL